MKTNEDIEWAFEQFEDEEDEYLYMCKTDYDYELGNAAGGVPVYSSLADLKEQRSCVRECGIVKVKVTLVEVVEEENF
jgi:hypothetical protein